MIAFRDISPTRRLHPSRSQTGKNWANHKPELREDFNYSCGYCNSHDGYRHTYFEVDHFIPKAFFKKLGGITLSQYDNLVYSCKFCNLAKKAKWPSASLVVHHDGLKGFVDPCHSDYETHFQRDYEGMIIWKSQLGEWMFKEDFKFDERSTAIKLLYNIRKLELVIEGMIKVLAHLNKSSQAYVETKAKVNEITFNYYQIHKELKDFYD